MIKSIVGAAASSAVLLSLTGFTSAQALSTSSQTFETSASLVSFATSSTASPLDLTGQGEPSSSARHQRQFSFNYGSSDDEDVEVDVLINKPRPDLPDDPCGLGSDGGCGAGGDGEDGFNDPIVISIETQPNPFWSAITSSFSSPVISSVTSTTLVDDPITSLAANFIASYPASFAASVSSTSPITSATKASVTSSSYYRNGGEDFQDGFDYGESYGYSNGYQVGYRAAQTGGPSNLFAQGYLEGEQRGYYYGYLDGQNSRSFQYTQTYVPPLGPTITARTSSAVYTSLPEARFSLSYSSEEAASVASPTFAGVSLIKPTLLPSVSPQLDVSVSPNIAPTVQPSSHYEYRQEPRHQGGGAIPGYSSNYNAYSDGNGYDYSGYRYYGNPHANIAAAPVQSSYEYAYQAPFGVGVTSPESTVEENDPNLISSVSEREESGSGGGSIHKRSLRADFMKGYRSGPQNSVQLNAAVSPNGASGYLVNTVNYDVPYSGSYYGGSQGAPDGSTMGYPAGTYTPPYASPPNSNNKGFMKFLSSALCPSNWFNGMSNRASRPRADSTPGFSYTNYQQPQAQVQLQAQVQPCYYQVQPFQQQQPQYQQQYYIYPSQAQPSYYYYPASCGTGGNPNPYGGYDGQPPSPQLTGLPSYDDPSLSAATSVYSSSVATATSIPTSHAVTSPYVPSYTPAYSVHVSTGQGAYPSYPYASSVYQAPPSGDQSNPPNVPVYDGDDSSSPYGFSTVAVSGSQPTGSINNGDAPPLQNLLILKGPSDSKEDQININENAPSSPSVGLGYYQHYPVAQDDTVLQAPMQSSVEAATSSEAPQSEFLAQLLMKQLEAQEQQAAQQKAQEAQSLSQIAYQQTQVQQAQRAQQAQQQPQQQSQRQAQQVREAQQQVQQLIQQQVQQQALQVQEEVQQQVQQQPQQQVQQPQQQVQQQPPQPQQPRQPQQPTQQQPLQQPQQPVQPVQQQPQQQPQQQLQREPQEKLPYPQKPRINIADRLRPGINVFDNRY